MQARFIGDPRNGGDGPAGLVLWGHSFPKGEWVPVESPDLFARLKNNDHFETREGAQKRAAEVVIDPPLAAEPEAEPQAEAEGGIPKNWREMHWKKRVALAKQLEPELAETINTAAEADQVIEWAEGKDNG